MVTGDGQTPPVHYTLSPAQQRSRRLRNVALALAIAVLVVLFYVVTIAKMGAGFIDRPI